MPRKSTDFHFRLAPELRQRLADATKLVEVIRGDRPQRVKTQKPSVSELVVAFIEAGLGRLENGLPIVEVPSMIERSARQDVPSWAGGGYYRAPLNSGGLYAELEASPRPLAIEEGQRFDLDARHIVPGAKVVLRGLVFTQNEEFRHLVGEAGKVKKSARKLASVAFGRRKPVEVHVYDLAPLPGREEKK